jgi:hypothetical protein
VSPKLGERLPRLLPRLLTRSPARRVRLASVLADLGEADDTSENELKAWFHTNGWHYLGSGYFSDMPPPPLVAVVAVEPGSPCKAVKAKHAGPCVRKQGRSKKKTRFKENLKSTSSAR